jgi:hypothetical protein
MLNLHPPVTTFLLLQLASTCTILPCSGKTVTEKEKIHKKNHAVYPCKSRQNMAFEEITHYDKNTFYLPRHSSFTINQTFANLCKTGQNVPESVEITTI